MNNFVKIIVFITALYPLSSWSKEADLAFYRNQIVTPNQQVDDDWDTEFASYETENVKEIYDPLEKYNRKIFIFNDYFDRYFLEHIARFYHKEVPPLARHSIRNFLINLSLPISTFNSLLQGKADNSLATISTFLINSTIGILGLRDVAGERSIRYKLEDFGQTLGHYGVTSGAYLMLPFLGPSSSRDFTGLLTDKAINPIEFNVLEVGGRTNLIEANYRLALAAAAGIDTRESLLNIIDDIREDSFDPYATIRSAYSQKRLTDVKN